MAMQKPTQPGPQPPAGFSQEQYDLLISCSKAHDLSAWNAWRDQNPRQEILLEGADLAGAYLAGANLSMANLRKAGLVTANLDKAILNLADFAGAHLSMAHLEGTGLSGANFQGADLTGAHLERAYLLSSNLGKAALRESHLNHATFFGANLQGASFAAAIVDGGTYIWDCAVDGETDFLGVGLDSARVEPGLKQLLQYNVRRLRWREWYAVHAVQQWPVRLFWLLSDYGRSTGRIILSFFVLSMLFAGIYWAFPEMVANLTSVAGHPVAPWLVPFRALYFSVVTMTTLGYGDLHAAPDSLAGYLLLMTQIMLGYLTLGALVTRFSFLFSAGGPETQTGDANKSWLDQE